MPVLVVHDHNQHRFTTVVDGIQAELDYRQEGSFLVITHTGVPAAISGRGIAGELVRAAFDHAAAAGLKVRPECSYAAAWARKHHAEYADVLT